ncbi:MAG: hypothetical protein LEGION0398_MBIBDBAK_00078 [Legionellaceae bacterium]
MTNDATKPENTKNIPNSTIAPKDKRNDELQKELVEGPVTIDLSRENTNRTDKNTPDDENTNSDENLIKSLYELLAKKGSISVVPPKAGAKELQLITSDFKFSPIQITCHNGVMNASCYTRDILESMVQIAKDKGWSAIVIDEPTKSKAKALIQEICKEKGIEVSNTPAENVNVKLVK